MYKTAMKLRPMRALGSLVLRAMADKQVQLSFSIDRILQKESTYKKRLDDVSFTVIYSASLIFCLLFI